MPALLVVTLPIGIPAALVWLVALRWHEKLDPFPEVEPDAERLRSLGDAEDFLVQNAFTSRAPIRPGGFWKLTSRLTELRRQLHGPARLHDGQPLRPHHRALRPLHARGA